MSITCPSSKCIKDQQGEKYMATLENLEDFTNYLISIRPKYDYVKPQYVTLVDGDVRKDATTNIRTLQPPTITNRTTSTISLEWQPPTKVAIASEIQKYNEQSAIFCQPLYI